MSTSINRTVAGARGALHGAIARGGRVLADLHKRYDERVAEDRIAKEVLGRWPNPSLDLARFTEEPELRDLAQNLARDLPTLRALAAARPQTPGWIMARIGQSWAGGFGAGAVDGLFGSQIPSLLGGLGFFLGWLHTDGDVSQVCLEVSRGMGAATLYSAAKVLTAEVVRGKRKPNAKPLGQYVVKPDREHILHDVDKAWAAIAYDVGAHGSVTEENWADFGAAHPEWMPTADAWRDLSARYRAGERVPFSSWFRAPTDVTTVGRALGIDVRHLVGPQTDQDD